MEMASRMIFFQRFIFNIENKYALSIVKIVILFIQSMVISF